MKERSIIFTDAMARAALDGRKTQMRQLVNPQPVFVDGRCLLRFAYGQPGDRLWVREGWYCDGTKIEYRGDYPNPYPAKKVIKGYWQPSSRMRRHHSRITLEVVNARVERLQDITEADAIAEGVRRDIGRSVPLEMSGVVEPWFNYEDPDAWVSTPVASFASLWRSINGPGSWAANPRVWRVEFKRATDDQVIV